MEKEINNDCIKENRKLSLLIFTIASINQIRRNSGGCWKKCKVASVCQLPKIVNQPDKVIDVLSLRVFIHCNKLAAFKKCANIFANVLFTSWVGRKSAVGKRLIGGKSALFKLSNRNYEINWIHVVKDLLKSHRPFIEFLPKNILLIHHFMFAISDRLEDNAENYCKFVW